MRWSRWGRSAYESDADLAAERALLATRVAPAPESSDAEIISLASKVKVDALFLDQVPSARLVVTTTSGYDHLDLPLLAARGVVAARMPLARRDAVVDHALAMLLSGMRRLEPLRAGAAAGRWMRGDLVALAPRGMAGRDVGVVGLGVIGQVMARVLTALGAVVWGDDPAGLPSGVRPAPVDALFARCEAITLHCALTPQTRGIVSRARLATARPGLVLVNTARGALLDLPAAVEALDEGRLGALGVDVFPTEPWPGLAAVSSRPGLLYTPHGAGVHDRLAAALREELFATVCAFLDGAPLAHALRP